MLFRSDDKLNVGIAYYYAYGGGLAAKIGGDITYTISAADTIMDFGGKSLTVGGGLNGSVLGLPWSIGAEISYSLDDPSIWSLTFSSGPNIALPIEMHGVIVETKVVPLFNLSPSEKHELWTSAMNQFNRYFTCS